MFSKGFCARNWYDTRTVIINVWKLNIIICLFTRNVTDGSGWRALDPKNLVPFWFRPTVIFANFDLVQCLICPIDIVQNS